jgi:NAD-dependent SIR2 family protein deacetylase
VIAMKQDLNPIIWKKARDSIKNSKLLLILGTQLAISSAITLVNETRRKGNPVIVINNSSIAIPLKKNEIILYYPVEKFFRILSVIKFFLI